MKAILLLTAALAALAIPATAGAGRGGICPPASGTNAPPPCHPFK